MGLESKTRKKVLDEKRKIEVTVVITPLTESEARQMFPYRPHNKYSESRYGGNSLTDDMALLLSGNAKRCGLCQAPTRIEYLSPHCPDCDGRSEYNGTNPRAK